MSKPKLILISFGALLFLAFLSLLTLNFETNDDPMMMFIASGALTLQPDAHLQCINILIGFLLKGLYAAVPGVNWYTGFLLSVHLTAILLVIVCAVYKREISFAEMLIFILLIFLGFESLFLVKLQFTATAFIAGFTAIICLMSRLPQALRLALFVLFLVIAFLLRREVIMPLLAFAGLAAVYVYRRRELSLLPGLAAAAAVLGIYLLSGYVNDHAPGYQEKAYYPYHRATDIICNNPIDTSAEKLARFGWSQNDVRLLNFSWYWADPDVYTHEKIVAFSQAVKTTRSAGETAARFLDFVKEERFTLLVVLLALGAVFITAGRNDDKLLAGLTLLVALALIAYLAATIRVPKRVSTPLMYYVSLLSLFLLVTQTARHRLRSAALGLMLLVCVYKFWCVYQLSELNRTKLRKFSESVALINRHPEDLFVVVSIGFPVEDMSILQQTQNLFPHRNLLFTGWFVGLPAYYDLLEYHKLSNPQRDFIRRQNIVFLSKGDRFMPIMTDFYREHYGVEATFTPYEDTAEHMKAYRIRFR